MDSENGERRHPQADEQKFNLACGAAAAGELAGLFIATVAKSASRARSISW
jgi:hypothetical protein